VVAVSLIERRWAAQSLREPWPLGVDLGGHDIGLDCIDGSPTGLAWSTGSRIGKSSAVCRPHHLSSAMCTHGQSVATQVIDAGAPIDFFRIASDTERSGTS
jgi:hypothetical protein